MTLEGIITLVKEKTNELSLEDYNGFLAVQVTLKDIEKVFYVEIKNKQLFIEPFEYEDRQAHLIISTDKFIKLINGKLNPIIAYSTGQLKVEGDTGKALELASLFK